MLTIGTPPASLAHIFASSRSPHPGQPRKLHHSGGCGTAPANCPVASAASVAPAGNPQAGPCRSLWRLPVDRTGWCWPSRTGWQRREKRKRQLQGGNRRRRIGGSRLPSRPSARLRARPSILRWDGLAAARRWIRDACHATTAAATTTAAAAAAAAAVRWTVVALSCSAMRAFRRRGRKPIAAGRAPPASSNGCGRIPSARRGPRLQQRR
jgi:hypothetical protein